MKEQKERVLRRLLLRCAGEHPLLAVALLLALAGSVALALVPPLVLERVVDHLAARQEVGWTLAGAYFAALALAGALDALKEALITRFGQKITHSVRSAMCRKLSRLPAAYFTGNDSGVTAARFVGDVDTVETLFASGVVGMAADACKVLGILGVILTKSLGLGLLLLAVTPLLMGFTRLVQRRMLAAQLQNREAVGRLTGFVPETLRCLRMLHVFRREEHMEARYDALVDASYRAVDRVNFLDAIYSPVIVFSSAAVIAAMMVLAATGGEMQRLFGLSVGAAVAVIAYVGKVFEPLESIGMEIQTVQSAIAGVRRISTFLCEEERPEQTSSATAEQLLASGCTPLDFSHVVFAYDADAPVLRNVSFTVAAGEAVTLAGRTGAGKSTLLKLALGFYAPQAGAVRVFGVEAAEIPDGCKRRIFGYVEQQFRPVPGTLLDQIAVFDPDITRAQVERAARLAGIHAAIAALPGGYDAPYAEAALSQGQKQLLSIARAVAADPAILLLDEITANLDAETEARVLAALRRASEQRTVLSVSHRLYEQGGGRVVAL